jgi:flagellar hook assembly protein FlgD
LYGFTLFQNYPNPFNPETKIQFWIPKSGNVKLTIYDVSGRQIDELVNRKLNAGTFEVTWNGSNLSSGIYFYKLVAEGFAETKKMIMVK